MVQGISLLVSCNIGSLTFLSRRQVQIRTSGDDRRALGDCTQGKWDKTLFDSRWLNFQTIPLVLWWAKGSCAATWLWKHQLLLWGGERGSDCPISYLLPFSFLGDTIPTGRNSTGQFKKAWGAGIFCSGEEKAWGDFTVIIQYTKGTYKQKGDCLFAQTVEEHEGMVLN